MMRSFAVIAVTTALSGLSAQEQPTSAPSVQEPLARVLAAGEEDLPKALADYIGQQIATGALFAGQYAGLRKRKDECLALLIQWAVEVPNGTHTSEQSFRQASIRAIRDVVSEPAQDEMLEVLSRIMDDESESSELRQTAMYALAQFGERDPVDAMIARLKPNTEAAEPRERAAAWFSLSDIYYNLRDYGESSKAYAKVLTMHENGDIDIGRSLPTVYYNCACSMALAGETEAAFDKLTKALELGAISGAIPPSLLRTDHDINALRSDPRFAELIDKHFGTDTGPEKRRKGDADK